MATGADWDMVRDRAGRRGAHRAPAARRLVHGGVLRGAHGRAGARGSPARRGDAAGERRHTPPEDVSIENYARLTAELAADLGCDVVVGHSMGANVALEMAASGAFSGPLVLLAPSLLARGRGDRHPHPRPARPRRSVTCRSPRCGG